MFLVGHAAVGAILATASGTSDPAVAFGIGWLSHYLADFVPHGDEAVGEWTKKGNEIRRLLFAVGIDALILAVPVALFMTKRGFSWTVAAAIIGAFVPDIMWGLEKVFKRKLFWLHEKFHHRNHNFFNVRMPLAAGLLLQFVATAAMWAYLIR